MCFRPLGRISFLMTNMSMQTLHLKLFLLLWSHIGKEITHRNKN